MASRRCLSPTVQCLAKPCRALQELYQVADAGLLSSGNEALTESKLAARFVRQIGLLYAAEKELREKKAGPRLEAAIRSWQSRPILAWPRLAKARALSM